MKVFVTGSEGQLGTATVPALQQAGHEVSGYDLRSGQNIIPNAVAAILAAVDHPGPFWYEVINVVDGSQSWARTPKAAEVLGLSL